MSDILNQLIIAEALGTPVCIDRDTEDDKFSFGVVLTATEDFASIYMIAPDGSYDGISIRQTVDIGEIDFLSGFAIKYSEKMRKLSTPEDYNKFPHSIDPLDPVGSVLKIAKEEHRTVSVELGESGIWDYEGFVESVKGDSAEIRCVDEFGYEKVSMSFSVGDVTALEYESLERRIIDRLWEINYRNG